MIATAIRRFTARQRGIVFVPPNYIYRDVFTRESVIIDVGCANDADFSRHLIKRAGLKAFGVDPTRKHGAALRAMEAELQPHFAYLPLAVCERDGSVMFNESVENVSGSMEATHVNVIHDHLRTYSVEATTLRSLVFRTGCSNVDLIKIDIEGAEYGVFRTLGAEDVGYFKQIFIEFHHDTVQSYRLADTLEIVRKLQCLGFSAFSADDRNYLFYKL